VRGSAEETGRLHFISSRDASCASREYEIRCADDFFRKCYERPSESTMLLCVPFNVLVKIIIVAVAAIYTPVHSKHISLPPTSTPHKQQLAKPARYLLSFLASFGIRSIPLTAVSTIRTVLG